jgi:hypothetical protein
MERWEKKKREHSIIPVLFAQDSNVPVFQSSHPIIDWDHDHEKSLFQAKVT